MVENAKLKNDIEELKKQLLEKEKSRGGTFEVWFPANIPITDKVFCLSKDLDVVVLLI